MKIDPNAPAYPIRGQQIDEDADSRNYGIPIRLAIAAQMMAGAASGPNVLDEAREALIALKCADALIAAYNESAS